MFETCQLVVLVAIMGRIMLQLLSIFVVYLIMVSIPFMVSNYVYFLYIKHIFHSFYAFFNMMLYSLYRRIIDRTVAEGVRNGEL